MSTTEDLAMHGEEETSLEIAERVGITEHTLQVMPLMTDDDIRRTWRLAKSLAMSRMFKDAVQAEQAFAKILIGRDLGISPTQSLMAIDLVKGAIQLRGVLLASFVRKHPDYHYKVLEKTHVKSRIQFLGYPQDEPEDGLVRSQGKWWEVLGEEDFTIEDAQRAKLVKNDSAWQHHPKNMCFWRCISNAVKTHSPELLGGIPVYVEGEIVPDPPAYSQPARPQDGETQVAELPDPLDQLVARANALDPREWRQGEVAARLPEPNTEGYQETLDALVAEVTAWLGEHEPTDAEVVDAQPADEPGTADQPEPEEAGVESVDVPAALQERWTTDAEWRAQAGPAISRYADLESALDAAVAEADEANAEGLREQLVDAAETLDALGVPAGWMPEEGTDGDAQLPL